LFHLGYSVFAVTQVDPSTPPALPHTEADDLGNTLPEPHSANRPNLQSFISHSTVATSVGRPEVIEGMEDEDYELQAALQASLMGDVSSEPPPPIIRHSVPLPPSNSHSSSSNPLFGTPVASVPSDAASDLDPVTATMERNRLLLERMKAEQEYAQRQLWADEGIEGPRERNAEEEMIMHAIAESETSARVEGHGRPADVSLASEVSPEVPVEEGAEFPSNARYVQDRVYDDDDAELRELSYRFYYFAVEVLNFFLTEAALKASLAQLPDGWALPEQIHHESTGRPSTSVEPGPIPQPGEDLSRDIPLAEDVSVDELRRRRLARFGS
jgi:ataxin-3